MHKHSSVFLTLTLFFWVSTGITAEVIEFSGEYVLRTDEISQDILGNQVCFLPTPETADRAPRNKNDKRLVWFCFSNNESAMNVLSISGVSQGGGCGFRGTAEVRVSKYVVYRGEGDGNDRAELVSAKAISIPSVIPCE
ncbi:MAG: hypothetical protein LBE81_03980 [Azonexus sp.]|jgi:hypothetical protein|uniref:hypothetical protein n=1 Tax=Azonexus sp. TaxID=1872668 RepID=UPI00281D9194|nr:hypothetical protein [Azonexus sp.]MDR0775780.1 hypothetical protein [Azonexus sp.]